MLDTLGREDEASVGGATRRVLRGGAVLVLGGLTSMEVLALVLGFVSVMGLLWATDTVPPETLVTNPWLRAGWVVAVVAVLRPVTWIPWIVVFVILRRGIGALSPRGRPGVANAVANLGTAAIFAGAAGLVFAGLDGAARWTASALGFVSGSVRFTDLGTATGQWDAARILALTLVGVLIRPLVPPFGLDLDLATRPLLGVVPGGRGRFDLWLVGLAAMLALVAGVAAVLG